MTDGALNAQKASLIEKENRKRQEGQNPPMTELL